MDKYYYDCIYQQYMLEFNLHNKRKELLRMLDCYEKAQCDNCLTVKCRCTNSVTPFTSANHLKRNTDDKNKNNNELRVHQAKDQVSTQAEELQKSEKIDQNPATSTPEKSVTVNKDIKSWMNETSMKPESYKEKMVSKPSKSLVTIESVRPADLPLKTLQRSGVLNGFNYVNYAYINQTYGPSSMKSSNSLHGLNRLNSSNMSSNIANLDIFFNHFNQSNDTKVAPAPPSVASACNKQGKKNYYSYF